MRLLPLVLALGAAALHGCAAGGAVWVGGSPLTGRWGGAHADLTLTPSGGTIEYDCAHGGLIAPLVPDGAGAFSVVGVHVPERGGPVREGEVPDSLPARFVGQLSRDRMTLRVLVGSDTLGPFELQLGAAPLLFRCL